MEPADYERWLSEGTTRNSSAAQGETLFRQYGCSGCHGLNSSVRAPMLNGIYGKPVAIEVPEDGNKTKVIIADDRYIHDSIILPEKEVAAGFKPIMPTFKNRLSEADVLKLIAYIKSLSTSNGTSNGMPDPQRTGNVGVEDIRTRAGFVPPNMAHITRNAQRNSSASGTYTDEQLNGGTAGPANGTSANPVSTAGDKGTLTGRDSAGVSTGGAGQTPATNSPNNRAMNERTGR